MNSRLIIYSKQGSVIASVEKWEFSDTVMGEQFLTMDVKSPTPIQWTVGCYCTYRGQQYILNYIPSVTQTAHSGDSGEAFTYNNIKMESVAEELTRFTLLDITETDGEYAPAAGTNYTGSAKFSLYCGEMKVGGKTYTPVCVLAEKIYANLKRLNKGWTIHVDTTSTHKVNNEDILNTHTDEKMLSFSNNTIREALEKVNTEFDLDFSIQGRNIYIGYSLGRLTEDESITYEDGSHPFFHYGYGEGQPSVDYLGREVDGGTALYEIEKTADSSQKIVTRLRAMGSTKNMPYRYYNKKYNLSQSMYPSNLQLPDTFESPAVKSANNQARKNSGIYPDLRDVKGETNDAYIDKNDNAENTPEGIREHCAVWDGSDGELTEIYPTIKEVEYSELRLAGTKDMKGNTPAGDMQNAFVNYSDDDRVDEIAGISDLTNYGDGLLAEDTTTTQGQIKVEISSENQKDRNVLGSDWTTGESLSRVKILTIDNNTKGNFELTPAAGNVFFEFKVSAGRYSTTETLVGNIGFRLYVEDNNGTSLLRKPDGSTLPYYKSETQQGSSRNSEWNSIEVPALPDAKEASDAKVGTIAVPTMGVVNVYIAPYYTSFNKNGNSVTGVPEELNFTWRVGLSNAQRSDASSKAAATFVWSLTEAASTYMNTPFDLYLKDFGVQEMQKCFNTDSDAVISMTSGRCVGREFKIESEVPEQTTITYNGKTVNVWKVRCTRAQDDSLQRYYPSEVDPICINDTYVLLNVSMPESYIKAAEIRLLTAASLYLKDNCDTRYIYEPSIDDIYLQRDYDRCESNGNKEKSIYWRLYAGLKFPFYGIPASASSAQIDNIAEITIKTVTIKEGEGNTPKVEIILNDTIETSTIQKLVTAVDRIYNGSIFSTGVGGASDIATIRNQISEYGKELFLSKIDKDTAQEIITFMKGLKVGSKQFGIDGYGNAILNVTNAMSGNFSDKLITKDLIVTGMAKFFELVVEKVSSAGGAIMLTPAEGFVVEQVVKDGNLVTMYWKSTDGNGGAIKNMWKVEDQAFCQSFNSAANGESYSTNNKKWWYKVTDVTENEGKTFDGEQSRYNSITIDLGEGMEGSSTDIAVGDNVVMLGYQGTDDANRQCALYLSSYDSIDQGYADSATGKVVPPIKAPFMAQYKGINDFNLAKHRKSYYDATGAHIIGSLTVESDSGETPLDEYIHDNRWEMGRNLLTGTNKGSSPWWYSTGNGTVSKEDDTAYGVHFTVESIGTSWHVMGFNIADTQTALLKPNTKYCLSMDVNPDVPGKSSTVSIRQITGLNPLTSGSPVISFGEAGVWKRTSVVLTTNDFSAEGFSFVNQTIYINIPCAGNFRFRNIKLEEGEEDTGYCLAEEDKIGADGTSPIMCDLTNEMDSVACSSSGMPVTGGNTKNTTVILYNGSALDASIYKMKVGTAAASTGDVATATACATGITYTRSGNTLYFTMASGAADSTAITISATSATDETVQGTCTFTLTKTKQGNTGTSPTVYSLNVDADVIARSQSGTNAPASLTVKVNRTIGVSTTSSDPASSSYRYVYYKKYYANGSSSTEAQLIGNSLDVSDVTSKIEIYLYSSSARTTLLDMETICVVKDGQNGQKGIDAVEFVVNPSPISFTTGNDGKVASGQKVEVKAMKGGTQVAITSLTPGTHVNCYVDNSANSGNTRTFTLTVSGYTSIDGISGTYNLAPTSGMAVFTAVVDGVSYPLNIPFSVDVKAVFNKFSADVNAFKSTYDAFTKGVNGTLQENFSQIEQTAKNISLEVAETSIGGNLLTNSDFRYFLDHTTMNDCYIVMNGGYNGANAIKSYRGASGYVYIGWSAGMSSEGNILLEKGTYTISFYYKNCNYYICEVWKYRSQQDNARSTDNSNRIYPTTKSNTQVSDTGWYRYMGEFELNEDTWVGMVLVVRGVDALLCMPQLTKGKSTGHPNWNPSPLDADRVNGNMLVNSDTLEAKDGELVHPVTSHTLSLYPLSAESVYPLSASTGNYARKYCNANEDIIQWVFPAYTFKAGDDVVLSFWAKAFPGGALLSLFFYTDNGICQMAESSEGTQNAYEDGCVQFKLGTSWKQYWVHWHAKGSNDKAHFVMFRGTTQSEYYYIAQPKLERGCAVTAYTTSREDIIDDSSIATAGALAKSGIDITARKIVAFTDNFVVAAEKDGSNPFMTVDKQGIHANNIIIDKSGVFGGTLTAASGSFSGSLSGANGYFGGFIRKKKTVITESNFNQYFSYYSDLEGYIPRYNELANWLYFESTPPDILISMGMFRLDVLYDDMRELIGTNFIVYNRSGQPLSFTGKFSSNIYGNNFNSFSIDDGYMAYLECRVCADNGIEQIFWYYVQAQIR